MKVIVAGASGLVGLAAVEHFATLPGWDVVGVSRRHPGDIAGAQFTSLDLDDADACGAFAREHTDTTHFIYAALFEKPGLVPGWYERDQMEHNAAMLRNLFEPLSASASGLQHVSLLQGTKAYGVHVEPMAVPARERWPRHQHENFYWLQEDYLREKQRGARWHWTIWRPQVIFGRALGANMNPIPALGVYGALLKEAGEPLWFPGDPLPFLFEGVDADLLAHALAWAATSPAAQDEIFNVTNGDVMAWTNVWPVIARALGMEPGEPKPISFAADLPPREAEWAKIVDRYRLVSPTSLDAFVGKSFDYMDFLMLRGASGPPPPALVSTVKLRQAGFGECIDSEDMLVKWFRRFQEERLLPPP